MTVAHDPAECARMVAELREDDARMTRAPWTTPTGTRMLGAVSAVIDGRERQVAAACGQAAQFDDTVDVGVQLGINAAGIARIRNNLPVLADQLEAACAEVERLRLQTQTECEELGRYVKANESLKSDLSTLTAERDSLRAEVARIPDLKAAIRYEIEKRDRFEAERDSLRAELERARQERDADVGNYHAVNDSLRQQLEAAQSALRWARARLLDIRNTSMVRLAIANILAGLNEAIEPTPTVNVDLAAAQRRIDELESIVQQTQGVHVSWVERDRQARERIAELESERDSVRQISGSAPHDATVDAVRSLMDSRDRMETDRATLRRRVAELEAERDEGHDANANLAGALGACHEHIEKLESSIRAILPVYRAAAVYVGPARSGGPLETWNDLIYALSTARTAITPEIAAVLAKMEGG